MKPEGRRRKADVVIIGGGASGLAAAAALGMSAPELDVLVIEKMGEPGRKLRATGSGRCNITNTAAEGYTEIMKFFTHIGLVTRVYENGLVYPYSESAADVAELLVTRAKELGVKFVCGEEVVSIKRTSDSEDHGTVKASSGNIKQDADKNSCVGTRRDVDKEIYKSAWPETSRANGEDAGSVTHETIIESAGPDTVKMSGGSAEQETSKQGGVIGGEKVEKKFGGSMEQGSEQVSGTPSGAALESLYNDRNSIASMGLDRDKARSGSAGLDTGKMCGRIAEEKTFKANSDTVKQAVDKKSSVIAERDINIRIYESAGEDNGTPAVFTIESVYKDKNCSHNVITEAGYVVLAAGGKAGPAFGTTGDGYRLARSLGHSIVTPVPVLTGIECKEWADEHRPCAKQLAGTRTRGIVTLYKYGRKDLSRGDEIFKEAGEIQFTNYGLSGICVFNMTRHMRYDRSRGEGPADFLVTADLFPDGDVREFLRYRRDNAFPGEKAGEVLRTVLKKNIAEYALRSASAPEIDAADRMLADLSDADIEEISRAVHSMTFHPERLRGWKDAQATAGGVSLEEIDEDTSESKIAEGLYITGELADRDFQCGGFNLSNAWITGLAAAASIARTRR